jgi:epsilon-lactone hydrolase
MSCLCYLGVCSDIFCGVCCSCFKQPTRPSWNKRFDLVMAITRRASRFAFKSVNDSDIPKLRDMLDKNTFAESDLPKGISVKSFDHVGDVSTLPFGEWVYPTTFNDPWLRLGEQSGPIILYLHGGGFCLGNVSNSHRPVTMKIASETNSTVLAINYRLAPEHPHPAADDDCFEAYKWLISQVSSKQVFIVGDSAGGALVVSVLVRARDSGIAPPQGAILISPWVDIFNSSDPSFSLYKDVDFLTPNISALGVLYISPPTDAHSAVNQRLDGLPPLLVEYGETELFAGQIRRFIDKALASGVTVEFHEHNDMVHDFIMFYNLGQPQCDQAFANMKKFIDQYSQN